MRSGNIFSKHSSGESGSMLLLLAILLVAIVTFIALAIDTTSYGTSQSEQQSTAQLAALSALESYAATPADPSLSDAQNHRQRMLAAIDRAEEIIGSARNKLFAHRGGNTQINAAADELADSSGVTGRTNAAAGTITAGQYFFTEPFGACTEYLSRFPGRAADACPCGGGSWSGECFRPLTAGETSASAFTVDLKTKDAMPLRAYVAPVIGQPNLSIHSSGRSAMIPTAGVYAVDLSLSGTFQTHYTYEALPAAQKYKASSYVFRLSGTGSSVCPASHANPCIGNDSCSFTSAGQRCTMYGLGVDELGEPCKPTGGLVASRPAALQEVWRHYRSDYECFTLDIDGQPGMEHYLIDTHEHDVLGGGRYIGPEPLSGIFAGINSALKRIEQRPLAGDTIAVMGFDKSVVYDRTAAENTHGRVIGPTHPGRPSFDDLLKVTDTQNADSAIRRANQLKRIENGFFTRPGADTDIPEAVLEAQYLLGRLGADVNARKYVTMITDGINNCVHWNRDDPNMPPQTHWTHFLYRDTNDNSVKLFSERCRVAVEPPAWDAASGDFYHPNEWDVHAGGLGEASSMISSLDTWTLDDPRPHNYWRYYWVKQAGLPTYIHQKIQFNAVLYGGQPHTLFRQSMDGGRCMTDEEARKNDQFWVTKANHEDGANAPIRTNIMCYHRLFLENPCPYYHHYDYFYRNMVRPTGGYFYALRQPCDMARVQAADSSLATTTAQCRSGAFHAKLNDVCAAASGPGEVARNAALTQAGVLDDVMNNELDASGNVTQTYRSPWNRLVCDDLCRSTSEQFTGLIDQIFAERPYMLTDERDRPAPVATPVPAN